VETANTIAVHSALVVGQIVIGGWRVSASTSPALPKGTVAAADGMAAVTAPLSLRGEREIGSAVK